MDKQPHLLIVDGNINVVTILKQTLRSDFSITAVSSTQEANRLLTQGIHFDCIVTELVFARFEGFDLLRTIRADRTTRYTPVLVLTSTPDSNTRIKCLDEGADSVIAKPFNPLEIRAKINAVLRRIDTPVLPKQTTVVRTGKNQYSFRQLTSKILSFIV
jgi:DNA-binding response OmpR family regulator